MGKQRLTLLEAINVGLQHHTQGQLDKAEHVYRQILQAEPDQPVALHLLGVLAKDTGHLDDAFELMSRSLSVNPDYAEAHNDFGLLLKNRGRIKEALESFRKAIHFKPGYAEAHNNLGNALVVTGAWEEAATEYREVLSIRPDFLDAQINLGTVLSDLGRYEESIESLMTACRIKPDAVLAHYNLGNVYLKQRRYQDAVSCYRKAVSIRPSFVEALNNLGNALKEQGQLKEAVVYYRKALETEPRFLDAHSNIIFCQNFMDDGDPVELLREAQHFGSVVATMVKPCEHHSNDPDPARDLRIGLVSGDFCSHPVSHFLVNVLEELKTSGMDLYCYATSQREDAMTSRIRDAVSSWCVATGMNDAALADRLRSDQIDILVDLSGHTAFNRLPVFASKAAPVQVGWLGYSGTTGIDAIDYILCDPWVLPGECENFYTEKAWRMPHSYLCFSPPDLDSDVLTPTRGEEERFTFGCLNNLTKITDQTVLWWAEILEKTPGSRLLLKSRQLDDEAVKEETVLRFSAHGITSDRLVLHGRSEDKAGYLATYLSVDIALDPYPYAGTTTSVDALWMGTPVLTLRGDRFVSRVGSSILNNIGLAEWVAETPRDYIEKAITFSGNRKELSVLRRELRQRLLKSPVCDASLFARDLEEAFRGMWKVWCKD